ncbi:hypothetical protein FNYG_10107 [Fusarium nygamai]|uniref:Clr5 domain-containing protein n=1 Tax=Gibberella nygamai TaxID=42673 RepID=A0A2K0W334_GIBNY|nr:hypothetical protein FNYG_10107 [Fusarium nygamai]
MDSSNLRWVYGPTYRAQDVSNEAVDKFKSIIQQIYLDQNRTRDEVLSHLQDSHGFSLSTNQFSKATKRWGFYKQPRQVRTNVQPPESITEEEEEEPPNPLNPLDDLFDFEPDVLDTIDETEACFETGGENVTDSQILEDVKGQFSYTGRNFVSEPPPSTNQSQPQAVDADFPCAALPFDRERSLQESAQKILQQLKTTQKFETRPFHINSKILAQVSFDNRINKKSRVQYLTCCYLFEEAVQCLERSGKTFDRKQHRVLRSNIDRLFALYRRDKDKLLASPNISPDMWSILCVTEQAGILDDLVDRLETNGLQFMTAVRACLGLCEEWMELVDIGLPRGVFQYDSLLLHQNAGKAIQNICRPLSEQSRFDVWQEAGYLFAFVWSNEQLEPANSSSWLKGAEISGLSPTQFLAIICRMIVYMAARISPDFRTISGKRDDAVKFICRLYLQAIEKLKTTNQSRTIKEAFANHFCQHHLRPDIDSENGNLESVQSYQRAAADFVSEEDKDTFAQGVLQAATLHEGARGTGFGSLASSRATNSASDSSSYLYAQQQCLTLLSSNPTMTRSLASGSSRGSSLHSFRAFQAASRAMATCLKEDQGKYIQSIED